ncbi:DUF21 domain-containing protein [Candidatus Dojkabacteria bacterium]|uniref:DUF21 domain-containing protein n=1 Tax=Candidatus Dojkabacteria bacterium TaxID=2099670 RepID=A0A955L6J7_9BACT|nr:DUF21 domain-containing protein [Candidatus Dojkabacteria bacterium]
MIFIVTILFVLLSGLFSGLNLGLLSLNKNELERKIRLGDENAKKVYPVRKQGNLLLTTLLLGNVAVNAALSIFLADVSSGLVGGLLSTALIVLFGEIIPQSYISRHALRIGASTAWITKIIIFVLYPVAKPIAFALDKILGEELPTIWSKEELKEIIKHHEDHPDSLIDQDEERIIIGALSYSNKEAKDVMTPRTVVYAIEQNETLDQQRLTEIKYRRYTRIPVYSDVMDNVVGIIFAKDLLAVDDQIIARDVMRKDKFIKIKEEQTLDDLLNMFINKRIHLACVYDEFGGFSGVVTLEDVIEEILQEEVYDEGETMVDLRDVALSKGEEVTSDS